MKISFGEEQALRDMERRLKALDPVFSTRFERAAADDARVTTRIALMVHCVWARVRPLLATALLLVPVALAVFTAAGTVALCVIAVLSTSWAVLTCGPRRGWSILTAAGSRIVRLLLLRRRAREARILVGADRI